MYLEIGLVGLTFTSCANLLMTMDIVAKHVAFDEATNFSRAFSKDCNFYKNQYVLLIINSSFVLRYSYENARSFDKMAYNRFEKGEYLGRDKMSS